MEALLHQIAAGLATGGIYASVALALVMIHQATHLVNFAQGEMAMFTTYIAWALVNAGVPYWAAFALTVVAAFAIGVAIQRVVLQPIRGGSVLSLVVVFIGLLAIFNSLAGWIFSYTIKSFPSPFPAEPPFGQPSQTRDGIKPRVPLAHSFVSRWRKEQFAVFGNKEKEQPVNQPQQLAVIILLVEFAFAQFVKQHLISWVREEAASERPDCFFDAAAQGFERARALFVSGLRPLLQPA